MVVSMFPQQDVFHVGYRAFRRFEDIDAQRLRILSAENAMAAGADTATLRHRDHSAPGGGTLRGASSGSKLRMSSFIRSVLSTRASSLSPTTPIK